MPIQLDQDRWLSFDDPRFFRTGYRYRGTGFTLFLFTDQAVGDMMLVVRDRWGTEVHHHVMSLVEEEARDSAWWDEGKRIAEDIVNIVARTNSLDIPGG